MNEEELVSYVVRYCKHELSEEEYRFLQRWLEEKQENRQTFRECQSGLPVKGHTVENPIGGCLIQVWSKEH